MELEPCQCESCRETRAWDEVDKLPKGTTVQLVGPNEHQLERPWACCIDRRGAVSYGYGPTRAAAIRAALAAAREAAGEEVKGNG